MRYPTTKRIKEESARRSRFRRRRSGGILRDELAGDGIPPRFPRGGSAARSRRVPSDERVGSNPPRVFPPTNTNPADDFAFVAFALVVVAFVAFVALVALVAFVVVVIDSASSPSASFVSAFGSLRFTTPRPSTPRFLVSPPFGFAAGVATNAPPSAFGACVAAPAASAAARNSSFVAAASDRRR